ncbi:hypothetical protein DVH24_025981, partial [Malus domestica]
VNGKRYFLWGATRAPPPIAWRDACKRIDKGGRGLRPVMNFNKAAVAKLGWRMLFDHSKWWVQLVRLKDINFWVLGKPLAAFLSDQERQSIDWSLTFSDVIRDYCWDIPKLLSLVLHPDIVEVIRAIPLPEDLRARNDWVLRHKASVTVFHKVAHDLGFSCLEVEGDSKVLIDTLNGTSSTPCNYLLWCPTFKSLFLFPRHFIPS